VASPEAAASILWRDSSKAIDAATSMKITAQDLEALGVIDMVVKEPVGGAHRDRDLMMKRVGEAISKALAEFEGKSPAEVRRQRQDRFLEIGRSL
jgi:acetyl-CoA carboxylase carboxyl transferase subunit alpha